MYDHFTSNGLDNNDWVFCNMSTPCCEIPKRKGDSLLCLPEHQMWNEGNCLLGRKFLHESSVVSAEFAGWDAECTGAGIGYYGGNGSFHHYVLLAVTDEALELRVHSGSQNGESFMAKGQPKWLVAASASWEKKLPVELELRREGDLYSAHVNGKFLFGVELPEIKGDARPMYKALPWEDRLLPTYAYLDWAKADGFAPTAVLKGCVRDQGSNPIPCAGVHIAGFDEFFVRADENGCYEISNAPRGNRVIVAAAEGYGFVREEKLLHEDGVSECDFLLTAETQLNLPRREYNNPSFDRSQHGYHSLNGTWEFCFDPQDKGISHYFYEPQSDPFDRHIRVPFSWSSLMGFGEEHLACGDNIHESNTLFNNYRLNGEFAWYKRRFTVPESYPAKENVILHIGASSNVSCVWVDGNYKGMRVDEYSDLVFDLGQCAPGSEHVLVVRIQYPHDINSHNMGKQIFWFASAPGIWQSVWLEHRKCAFIQEFLLTPELQFDGETCSEAKVNIKVKAEHAQNGQVTVRLTAPISEKKYAIDIALEHGVGDGFIAIDDPKLWQYLEGNLYTAVAELVVDGESMDSVKSYVGLRKIETKWLEGHSPSDTDDVQEQYQYVYLNNKPFYVMGILDQCYNAFGIYTYRSFGEEGEYGKRGSIQYDIDRTIEYGYNVSRVHIKENEPLWYHECDRRGLPVWTEHPSNFYATPEDPNWQEAYYRELDGMLKRLNNFSSIVILSSINESWGVEGCHTSTPWENELRSEFLENNALRSKAAWSHVLICDNSGFGKTNACEINDFHIYPNDYFVAKVKWEELVNNCYPGSTYNFINSSHSPHGIGKAVQEGRPVMVSEFLHINGIDMQLRMFEKIAGYVRMNVASHETENSGPLTAERFERDYGYVDHEMNAIGYNMVNNMDMIVMDQCRIQHVVTGEEISVDLYTSHFSWNEANNPVLRATVTGINRAGQYVQNMVDYEEKIDFRRFCVEKQKSFSFQVPENIRGAYVFFYVEDDNGILCRNYFQILVKDVCEQVAANEINFSLEDLSEFSVEEGVLLSAHANNMHGGYINVFKERGAHVLAVTGCGEVEFAFGSDLSSGGTFTFEASAHEGKNATKVTDEVLFGTEIQISIDGKQIGVVSPLDDPSDERGLFSNAAQSPVPYNYAYTGRIGYGERFEVEIPAGLFGEGDHVLKLNCSDGGMVIYGSYAGRYGFNPIIKPYF